MNIAKILDNSNILIVGAGKSGKLLAEKLIFENFYGINIAGFVDENISEGKTVLKDIKVVGKLNEIQQISRKLNVHEIIIAPDDISYEKLMQVIDKCTSLESNLKLTSELFNIIPEKIVTEAYSGIPVVDLSLKVNKNLNYIYKRTFDYLGSALAIIILSPLFVLILILVRLSSPGKIFYNHIRIGKNGKPFKFYKFRTMHLTNNDDVDRIEQMKEFIKQNNNAESSYGKIVDENRVTAIGKFLRRTSLDELPQLFNVLKGDMSLVGPRPCLPYEYELFDEWHKRRHSVLPGCTGVWQVSGRSSVSFKDSVVLDLYYINNITPWLDLQLIFKTIPVMLLGRGAK